MADKAPAAKAVPAEPLELAKGSDTATVKGALVRLGLRRPWSNRIRLPAVAWPTTAGP